jgi:hypothetical protein
MRYRVQKALAVLSLLLLARGLRAKLASSDQTVEQAQRLIEQGNLGAARDQLTT